MIPTSFTDVVQSNRIIHEYQPCGSGMSNFWVALLARIPDELVPASLPRLFRRFLRSPSTHTSQSLRQEVASPHRAGGRSLMNSSQVPIPLFGPRVDPMLDQDILDVWRLRRNPSFLISPEQGIAQPVCDESVVPRC